MEEAIKKFPEQFKYEAEVKNSQKLENNYDHYILGGMGGSHLAADLIKIYKTGIDLYVHKDYDLPPYSDEFFKKSLLIASSYSGNTEEAVSFLEEGYSRGYNIAVIATGGKLIKFAKENNLPYVEMPDTGIQPRSALGFALRALSKILGNNGCCTELGALADILKPMEFKPVGEALADSLKGKIPIIYGSSKNLSIIYNWKIKMNETGKIPAFYNIFPELNHNEMQGFDLSEETADLGNPFHFIFLKDSSDHEMIQNRMKVTEDIYEERGLSVTSLYLDGNSIYEKIFNSLMLADWTAVSIAKSNSKDPESVPMVEDFKKRLKNF